MTPNGKRSVGDLNGRCTCPQQVLVIRQRSEGLSFASTIRSQQWMMRYRKFFGQEISEKIFPIYIKFEE